MEAFIARNYKLIFGMLLIAIVVLAFYVGYLEGEQGRQGAVTLSCDEKILSALAIPSAALANSEPEENIPTAEASSTGKFAGSKNGTKYYTPGCSGLDRIKPENLIWFESEEDATLQGYTPANC